MRTSDNIRNNKYILGFKTYDTILFFILFAIILITSYSITVYHHVIASNLDFHRIDPSGEKAEILISNKIQYGAFSKEIFWRITREIIDNKMEIQYQNKIYKPKTKFVWTVNYSYNSIDMDRIKTFVYQADENGKLLYKPQ